MLEIHFVITQTKGAHIASGTFLLLFRVPKDMNFHLKRSTIYFYSYHLLNTFVHVYNRICFDIIYYFYFFNFMLILNLLGFQSLCILCKFSKHSLKIFIAFLSY